MSSINSLQVHTPIFTDKLLQDSISVKKLEKYLERVCEVQKKITFETPELYPKFLQTIADKKNSFANQQLYRKTLQFFKNTLSLPQDVIPTNVEFYSQKKLVFSCPEELLPCTDYFKTILHGGFIEASSSANSGTYQLNFVLSEPTLHAFKKYLYTGAIGDIDVGCASELHTFADMIGDESLTEKTSEQLITLWIDDRNEASFNPDAIKESNLSTKFVKRFFKEKQIEAIEFFGTDYFSIKLSDFISLFQKKNSPVLSFVASYLSTLLIDTEDFELLWLISKQYRSNVCTIAFFDENFFSLKNAEDLLTRFPLVTTTRSTDSLLTKLLNDPSPKNAVGYRISGELLKGKHRFPEAEAEFRKALSLEPNSAFAHTRLGEIYWLALKWDESETSCLEALKLDPKNALAHVILGDVLRFKGKWDEAETSFREALKLNPKNTFAHATLGEVLRLKGKFDESETSLREALKLNPTNAFAHAILGDVLRIKGKFDESETSLREALKLNPTNAFAHAILGDVLRIKGKWDEAETSFREALKLDPKNAFAIAALGEVLRLKGELEEAKQEIKTPK